MRVQSSEFGVQSSELGKELILAEKTKGNEEAIMIAGGKIELDLGMGDFVYSHLKCMFEDKCATPPGTRIIASGQHKVAITGTYKFIEETNPIYEFYFQHEGSIYALVDENGPGKLTLKKKFSGRHAAVETYLPIGSMHRSGGIDPLNATLEVKDVFAHVVHTLLGIKNNEHWSLSSCEEDKTKKIKCRDI